MGADVTAARRRAAARVAGAGAALALATAAAGSRPPAWEERWFVALNAPADPLEPLLWPAMQLGSLVGPPLVGAMLWSAGRRSAAAGAVAGGVGAWQAAKVVKRLVRRGRPHELVATFARRSGTPYDGCGFVSGHTAVAAALAAVVSGELPASVRPVPYGVAAVVGFARIHVSAHLPLDVVGGAALGYGIGWSWRFYAVGRVRP